MCLQHQTRAQPHAQAGQVLPVFAIVVIALIAVTALVIDTGFLFGQRRYDQNGADAAALAAARLMATSVSPFDNNGNTFFAVSDADVYNEALKYVNPNQNGGLASRNSVAWTLEYWDGATLDSATGNPKWCHSALSPQPPRSSPVVSECTWMQLVIGSTAVNLPPQPALGHPYQVRVTVSSTTEPFFAQVAGIAGSTQAVTTDPDAPACLRSGTEADAHMTCAQAIADIRGISTPQSVGPILPVTTGDCDLAGDPGGSDGRLHQLWGSSPNGCGYNLRSWKNMIDLSDRADWCSDAGGGSNGDPDYKYFKLLPPASTTEPDSFKRATCGTGSATDTNWDRGGGDSDSSKGFRPDTGFNFTGQTDHDVAALIALGFHGYIWAAYPDGNKVPTYSLADPGQGANLGQNVAAGFYCGSSGVTANGCPTTINPAGTYYFARNQPGMQFPCDDLYEQANPKIGCRDAAIPIWGDESPTNLGVDWAVGANGNGGGSGWAHSGGGDPDRVRLVRLLVMRIYCEESGTDPTTGQKICAEPPKSIVGNAANSDVWGRFISPFKGACPVGVGVGCTGSPSIYGNIATLVR